MQSIVISARNNKIGFALARKGCAENKIDELDCVIFESEKALGIKDVRTFQANLMLKPIKSAGKAVVLNAQNGITIEAQNALLKSLEEPPPNTFIYIIVPSKELLLSTIISRCKIIELSDEIALTEKEKEQFMDFFAPISEKSIGERLKLAQDIAKNKNYASLWLERMILAGENALKSEGNLENLPNYANILRKLNHAYKIITSTNVSKRMILENLLLAMQGSAFN